MSLLTDAYEARVAAGLSYLDGQHGQQHKEAYGKQRHRQDLSSLFRCQHAVRSAPMDHDGLIFHLRHNTMSVHMGADLQVSRQSDVRQGPTRSRLRKERSIGVQ